MAKMSYYLIIQRAFKQERYTTLQALHIQLIDLVNALTDLYTRPSCPLRSRGLFRLSRFLDMDMNLIGYIDA